MATNAQSTDAPDLITRLRRVLVAVDLNSPSENALEGALTRFASLEHRRYRRKALSDAREHKDWIIARLAFLSELDEISERETDNTVFEEMALLFDEIGAASSRAAVAVRSVASTDETAINGIVLAETHRGSGRVVSSSAAT